MPFDWICPGCNTTYHYKGNKTKDANTTCTLCDKAIKIYQHRIGEVKIEENNFNNKLYFIKDKNYVKIGYTKNIGKRLEALQCGNPNKLRLIFLVDFAQELEIPLHNYYEIQNKHYRNEWFIYDELTERVINILKIYKKQINRSNKIKERILKGLNHV